MTTITELESLLKNKLGGLPVSVNEIPNEPDMLDVRVYNVPRSDFRAVKDTIHNLRNELFPDDEVLLVPILNSQEETEKYYPEMILRGHRLQFLLDKITSEYEEVMLVADPREFIDDSRLKSDPFDQNKPEWDGCHQHGDPADPGYALAA